MVLDRSFATATLPTPEQREAVPKDASGNLHCEGTMEGARPHPRTHPTCWVLATLCHRQLGVTRLLLWGVSYIH